MLLNAFFQRHVIRGKDIYVVDDHHKALAAWAIVRRSLQSAPNLITIDHHTDTHEAFLSYSHWESYEERAPDQETFRLGLVAQIDWRHDESIIDAIKHLKHDEHIDAATSSGTIANAFCIQLSDSYGMPATYAPVANRIYALSFECFIGCKAKPHNDDCLIQHSNEIIETRYLDDQLARGTEVSRCIGLPHIETAPYILDIDLDVFHTRKAISPQNPTTFHRLIKNAVAITIATEAECVKDEWLDGEDQMSAAELLNALLTHIKQAL